MKDILLLAKNWGQSTDLCAKSSSHMLGSIRDQVLYSSHDVVEKCVSIDEFAEAWDLASDSCPNLGLAVFEKLDECWHEISCNNFVINCLCDLLKVSNVPVISVFHVPFQIYRPPYI